MGFRPIKDLYSIFDCFKVLDNLKHGDAGGPPIPTNCHLDHEEGMINKMVKESKQAPVMLTLGKHRHHNKAMIRNPRLKKESLAF